MPIQLFKKELQYADNSGRRKGERCTGPTPDKVMEWKNNDGLVL